MKVDIKFLNICDDIVELMEMVLGAELEFVWREQNKTSDCLAKCEAIGDVSCDFADVDLPDKVYGNYKMYGEGIVSFR